MTEITIYSKPNCVQCNATYQAFERKQLQYKVIDLSEDNQAIEFIKKLGYQQLPVVIVGVQHWSGFRPDKINALIE